MPRRTVEGEYLRSAAMVGMAGQHSLFSFVRSARYHRGRMEQIKGTALYDKYSKIDAGKDIVIGSIANDRMFYVLDNFFTGVITDMALVNSLSALKLGKQYVATTEKACAAVRVEKEIPLSLLERRFLQDESDANRQKGVSLANDICKNYRRDGKFFDEILDEAK